MLNQYILNPALAGIENYTDIKVSHRHQWVGINDAPVTTYLTAHMPLGKSDFLTSATGFRGARRKSEGQCLLGELHGGSAASRHRRTGDQR